VSCFHARPKLKKMLRKGHLYQKILTRHLVFLHDPKNLAVSDVFETDSLYTPSSGDVARVFFFHLSVEAGL